MTKKYNWKQRGGVVQGEETGSTSIIALLVFIIVCLVSVGAYVYIMFTQQQGQQRQQEQQGQQDKEVLMGSRIQSPGTILGLQPDPRFGPLSPEKSYYVTPDLRGQPLLGGAVPGPLPPGGGAIPINVQTQGLPDSYQQIGVLTAPGGTETSASPTRTVLPLFGRRTVYSRDKWNYYMRTDGINPVQVPVQFKRRNCDDDTGCDEILNGDSVGCPVLGQSYVANVYRNSTPRYLPAFF
jgi:hypothetical protein